MAYGMSICTARRLTEDEKKKYAEWYREIGLVGMGEDIPLPELRWDDPLVDSILSRPEDGQFCGCSNTVRIISDEEKAQLIALNAQKKTEKIAAECEKLRDKIKTLESGKLYTTEEARKEEKWYNDTMNDGGWGYVPHFPTYDELEALKRRLSELEED